jgi:hypothetical protein
MIPVEDVFIWTEAFNCGEILNPMLESYLYHNKYELNVFGTVDDFNEINISSPLLIYHNLNKNQKTLKLENRILNGYKSGHKGTSELWAYLISKRKERYFLHIDSDTVFLGDIISDLINCVKVESYNLAGSRRPYFHRTYTKSGRDGRALDKLPDVVNSDCFIFDKTLISLKPTWILKRKIAGKRQFRHPIVDFFDPISFEIIRKNGKVCYTDSRQDGSRSVTNLKSEFYAKRISFAAVGSGLNFYKNPEVKTSPGYRKFALASYSLYAKWLLNKDIPIPPIDAPEIVSKLKRLNKQNWVLDD